MVADAVAFAVGFPESLLDYGRFWFPVASFHGVCLELHCWLRRYTSHSSSKKIKAHRLILITVLIF